MTDVPQEKESQLSEIFNAALVRSIDDAIADILGRSTVAALHDHLLKFYNIPETQIPDRIEKVAEVLQRMFGLGSITLGRSIAKRLYMNLQLEFHSVAGHTLVKYVEEAKHQFAAEHFRN